MTEFVLDAAAARGAAQARAAWTPDAAPAGPLLVQRAAAFVTEDYLVEHGRPFDLPAVGVAVSTAIGIGAYEIATALPDPTGVTTGADARWLPTEDSFTAGGQWRSDSGVLAWASAPGTSPVLDTDYSYRRGDAETYRPALVFNGGAFMALSSRGWASAAATVVLVAVLRPGYGPTSSLVESRGDNDSPGTDFALRYGAGTVEARAGGQAVSHAANDTQARPVVLALSLGPEGGVLAVRGRTRSTQTFATGALRLLDTELYLGRNGTTADRSTTAVMDLLEVDYFARALDATEVESLVSTLDACYGASA